MKISFLMIYAAILFGFQSNTNAMEAIREMFEKKPDLPASYVERVADLKTEEEGKAAAEKLARLKKEYKEYQQRPPQEQSWFQKLIGAPKGPSGLDYQLAIQDAERKVAKWKDVQAKYQARLEKIHSDEAQRALQKEQRIAEEEEAAAQVEALQKRGKLYKGAGEI